MPFPERRADGADSGEAASGRADVQAGPGSDREAEQLHHVLG